MSSERLIYVLYGSQTGNSESIAKDMSEKLNLDGFLNKCLTLNEAKKLSLKEVCSFLIIVCSTTGNGDVPENADKWWRSVKLRSAPKDMFESIPYSVLALGDTNYDKFCYMGKSIDKRLTDLGAKRYLPLFCADEATDLEEVVESWKAALNSGISKYFAELFKSTSKLVENKPSSEEKTHQSNKSIESSDPELNRSNNCSEKNFFCSNHQMIPDGLKSLQEISLWLNLYKELEADVPANMIPRLKTVKETDCKYQLQPITNLSNDAIIEAKQDQKELEWTAESPFSARVLKSSWLTTNNDSCKNISHPNDWEDLKRVVKLDLSIENSEIQYMPGDSIGICCPNPLYAINIVMDRLRKSHNDMNLNSDSQVYASDGSTSSLFEFLSYKFDLMSIPKKSTIAQLSQYCTELSETQQMKHLCGKSAISKKLWSNFIESQNLGVAEILHLFPSCTPNFYQLISCLIPMPPRYYSISSSPLKDANEISIAFSLVRYNCYVKKEVSEELSSPEESKFDVLTNIRRSGLCTTYLETLLSPWLYPDSFGEKNTNVIVKIFHKPSITFRLPGSVNHPLILIGPGTGISPFIGFLEHREILETQRRKPSREDVSVGYWRGGFELEESDLPTESGTVGDFINSVEPGTINVFYGCRDQNDYLFKNELAEFLYHGTLSSLDVAMSRVEAKKVYVTHKILAKSKELSDLILNQGAYIYICGDGNQMAKDVHRAIKSILTKAISDWSEEQAESYIEEMKLRRRYLLDIW